MPDLNKFEKTVYKACIGQVVEASNGAVTEKEAQELLPNLNRISKIARMLNPDANMRDILPQILAKAIEDEKIGKLQKSFQEIKQKETRDTKIALVNTKEKAADQLKTIIGNILGTYDTVHNGQFSTDRRMKTLENQAISDLYRALDAQGLRSHFSKGIDELQVAQELSELNKDKGNLGLTGNKDALTVAKVVHGVVDKYLKMGERVGLFVPRLQGYSSQQTHDPDVIRHTGFKQWAKDIMPVLNPYNTYGTLDEEKWEDFMRAKYRTIISGVHQEYEQGVDTHKVALGSNIAKKAAAERTIHFNSTLDAYNYSNKYGLRSFREQIVSSLASMAKRIALAGDWGINAEANMRNIFKLIENNAIDQEDNSTLKALHNDVTSKNWILGLVPEKIINEITGKSRTPVQKNFWTSFNQWAMTLSATGRLGMATISAQSDLMNLAGHLATIEGSNPIMNFIRVAGKYYLPHSGDYNIIAAQCGVMAQALRAQMAMDRFGDMDSSGMAGKLAALYFMGNILHAHDQRIVNVMAGMMANHFGEMAEKSHAELPLYTKTWLDRFGINESMWNQLREHAFTGGDGNKYLTPTAADKVTLEDESERDDLRLRMGAMFNDAAMSTVPRAGARERLILYGGTAPSTPYGFMVRMAMQFKTFPITMITKVLNRNIYGQPKGAMNNIVANAMNFAMYIIIGATIIAVTKNFLSGKNTPDPTTVKGFKTDLVRGITAGGGLGYIGDVVLPNEDKEKPTDTIIKGLEGPIGGDLGTIGDDVWMSGVKNRFGSQTAKENKAEREHLAKDAVNIGSNYVPFANHFATKFLFNYYVRYAILNSIDPNYTNKLEKNMKKESGQSFIIPPAVNAKH